MSCALLAAVMELGVLARTTLIKSSSAGQERRVLRALLRTVRSAVTNWVRCGSGIGMGFTDSSRLAICSGAPRTVTVKFALRLLPAASVAVQVVVVTPIAKVAPDTGLHETLAKPELSVAIALNGTTAPVGLVALTVKLAGTAMLGSSVSVALIVTVIV
jgi:hypothetical protein